MNGSTTALSDMMGKVNFYAALELKDGELSGTTASRRTIGAQHSNVAITVMVTTAVDLF